MRPNFQKMVETKENTAMAASWHDQSCSTILLLSLLSFCTICLHLSSIFSILMLPVTVWFLGLLASSLQGYGRCSRPNHPQRLLPPLFGHAIPLVSYYPAHGFGTIGSFNGPRSQPEYLLKRKKQKKQRNQSARMKGRYPIIIQNKSLRTVPMQVLSVRCSRKAWE